MSPLCSQGINQKRLQRDAQVRLNDFCDRLRNLPSVDLSAQNLGEEGTAYVIEALAFNPGCTAVDLSKNGIASVGKGGWVGGAGGGNGGEEGTVYVIEAQAFNPGCISVDLSKSGISIVGKGGAPRGEGGGETQG